MDEDKDVNLDYAFKYFVDFKEKPEHVYFEHAYNQPSYKKYYSGYVNPAKYLFTTPVPNPVHETTSGNEHIDVETVGHTPPLFYNSAKINELVENEEMPEFEDNWMDKVDYRDWNVVKNRLFRSVVQVLEADYLARLAHKGLRDEAVKRHLMLKKTAFRLKRIYGSVGWEAYTAQWLHGFLLDKLPAAYLKIYTEAFQCLETKVPSHLLDHMIIPSSSLSVRSRILNPEAQTKKPADLFSAALSQHKPKKILGDPLLVLVPSNMGNSFQSNTRPFRLMSELSLLSTLVTVTVPKSSTPVELPKLLEQMISATVSKVIELQADYPARPIILIGVDAGSLLACHIAHGFNTKITAVVCLGFHLFTMEGKVGKANDKLLKIRTPILFVVGQNATRTTIDEIEEFRAKLQCRTGLLVVGGADDHLRVNSLLKMKCSLTQSVVDRCILNEIAEFLSEVIQPPKVVVSITHISNSDLSTSKTTATVSSAQAQLLKQLLSESAKKSRATIIRKTIKPAINAAGKSQIDHEYGTQSTRAEDGTTQIIRQPKTITIQTERPSQSDGVSQIKKLTTSGGTDASSESKGYHRIEFSGTPSTSFTYQIVGVNRKSPTNTETTTRFSPFPVFTRKTRGGRRPYQRRTLPPKRVVDKTGMLSSLSSPGPDSNGSNEAKPSTIENLTPDSLLDLPIVFADENDEENVINDVSLTSYEP
ncbi:KAT8 regulatory NSL complex subunit 3 [Planococcus citri]|uniref:KAT8 regulatory NSL complex subunit 3 n=1 Tax=Planococcus citri TaxID=170843 RepID=UPI0031F8AC17